MLECKNEFTCRVINDKGIEFLWYCTVHDKYKYNMDDCFDAGFGDTLERWLKHIGITPKSWIKFNQYKIIGGQCPILVKTPENELTCGCEERKSFLNKYFPYAPFRKIWSKMSKWGIIR